MPLTELMAASGRTLWRHKFLALLGLGYVAGSGLLSVAVQVWLATNPIGKLLAAFNEAATPEQVIIDFLERMVRPWLLITLVLLFVGYILLVWVVATVSEAGLIHLVRELAANRPISLSRAINAGRRYLVTLIAVDTLVFFPLFLVLFTLLLLTGGALIAFILYAAQGTIDPNTVLLGGSIVAILDAALLSLAVFGALLTLIFRQLAFRGVIIAGLGIKESVRQTWSLLRRHWVMISLILIILYVIYQLGSIVGSGVAAPAQLYFMFRLMRFSNAVTPPAPELLFARPLLVDLWHIGVALFHILLRALTFTFGSILWTLSYQHWQHDETNRH